MLNSATSPDGRALPRKRWWASRRAMIFIKSKTTQAVINLFNLLGVTVAGIGIYFAYKSLDEQRVAAAWSLIATARTQDAGNIGLINALQALAERDTRLDRLKLQGAHLAKIQLANAHLSEADLRDANLSDADLRSAKLDGADLRRANLRRANLRSASFEGANLDGADLSHADLADADLSGASARTAQLFRVNLTGAHLDLADLSGANLSVANMNSASLKGTRLNGTVLRAADLSKATLDGSIVHGADFQSVHIWRTSTKDLIPKRDISQECNNSKGGNDTGASDASGIMPSPSTEWHPCGPPADTIKDLGNNWIELSLWDRLTLTLKAMQ